MDFFKILLKPMNHKIYLITENGKVIIKKILIFIFLFFIFCVLSFGRPFILLHIGPIYITEIVIFLSLFLFFFDKKRIYRIPYTFLTVTFIYFILGCLYFMTTLLSRPLLALRNSVYVSYVLFLPLTFLIFSEKKQFKAWLLILILSSIIRIIIVRICIYRDPWLPLNELFGMMKPFHYALYFTISLSFFIPLFGILSKIKNKILIALLCASSLYILIIYGVRASWFALIVLFLLQFKLLNKKIFLKLSLYLVITFIVIMVLFLQGVDSNAFKDEILGKFTSLSEFIKNYATKGDEKPFVVHKEAIYLPDNPFYRVYQEIDVNHRDYSKHIVSLNNIVWRFFLWKTAINSGFESPIFGKGFGATPIPLSPSKAQSRILGAQVSMASIHNHILAIFYKMGLIGLSLFLLINVYAFLYGLNYLREVKDEFMRSLLIGSLGSFIVWHVTALFFDVIDSPPTSIFLWIIIGLIFTCVEVDKSSST